MPATPQLQVSPATLAIKHLLKPASSSILVRSSLGRYHCARTCPPKNDKNKMRIYKFPFIAYYTAQLTNRMTRCRTCCMQALTLIDLHEKSHKNVSSFGIPDKGRNSYIAKNTGIEYLTIYFPHNISGRRKQFFKHCITACNVIQ